MNTPVDFQYELERRPLSIQDQAAEWFMRWHCGDPTLAERFEYLQWLKTSPVHIRETFQVARLYSLLEDLKPLSSEAAVGPSEDPAPANFAGPRLRAREYSFVRRRVAAVAATLSIGFGVLTIAGAGLQEVDPGRGGTVSSVTVAVPTDDPRDSALSVGCQRGETSTSSACIEPSSTQWSMLHWQGICAFAAAVPLALVILIRRRKLTLEDIGALFVTFVAAGSLPVALRLSSLALPIPRDQSIVAFLEQHALYISAAGFVVVLISVMTICQFFAAQLRRGKSVPFQPEVPASNASARASETSQPDQERKVG
jgi:hypothetical protein